MKLTKVQREVLAVLAEDGGMFRSLANGGYCVKPRHEPYFLIGSVTTDALVEQEMIEPSGQTQRRIYYRITDAGKRALEAQS